jgi:hypothetical protein
VSDVVECSTVTCSEPLAPGAAGDAGAADAVADVAATDGAGAADGTADVVAADAASDADAADAACTVPSQILTNTASVMSACAGGLVRTGCAASCPGGASSSVIATSGESCTATCDSGAPAVVAFCAALPSVMVVDQTNPGTADAFCPDGTVVTGCAGACDGGGSGLATGMACLMVCANTSAMAHAQAMCAPASALASVSPVMGSGSSANCPDDTVLLDCNALCTAGGGGVVVSNEPLGCMAQCAAGVASVQALCGSNCM